MHKDTLVGYCRFKSRGVSLFVSVVESSYARFRWGDGWVFMIREAFSKNYTVLQHHSMTTLRASDDAQRTDCV